MGDGERGHAPGSQEAVRGQDAAASVARIPEAQTRFLREGEAASRIHHPHVVNVVDVGTEAGIPFLVMEFLEGLSLAELIEAGGRMEVERSVSCCCRVVGGRGGPCQGVVHAI